MRMAVTTWPRAASCTTPKSGIGAVGWIITIPVKTRAGRVRVRRNWFEQDTGSHSITSRAPVSWKSVGFAAKWMEKAKERWREGIRHRVTPLGAMMLSLLFACGILAFATGQNVFFLLLSLLLSSILISSFVNRLMLAGLDLRLDLPEHVMAGEPAAATLLVENQKNGLPSFALEINAPVDRRFHIPVVGGRTTSELPVEVVWSQRGQPNPIVVNLSTRFPFGFSVRRTLVSVPVRGLVYPSIRPQPGFESYLERLCSPGNAARWPGQDEPDQLRDYQPGDDWRRLAMRPSARAGRWIVRASHRAHEDILHLALDPYAPDWEATIDLAAYLIWELHARSIAFQLHLPAAMLTVDSTAAAYRGLRFLALLSREECASFYPVQTVFLLRFPPATTADATPGS